MNIHAGKELAESNKISWNAVEVPKISFQGTEILHMLLYIHEHNYAMWVLTAALRLSQLECLLRERHSSDWCDCFVFSFSSIFVIYIYLQNTTSNVQDFLEQPSLNEHT